MADVSTPCAAYKRAEARWQRTGDACEGEEAVKAAGDTYLPRPNPADKSKENQTRFDQYVLRASFFPASGRTLESLTGLAFAKFPEIDAPAALEDVTEDVDGAGQTLAQHMQETLAQVLQTGRAGLLADFPVTEGNTSKADEQKSGIRPTLTYYSALSVINWRTEKVGGKTKLSLVVLREDHQVFDGFGEKSLKQFRVLLLDGTYKVQIWREKEKSSTSTAEYEQIGTDLVPKGGNGQALDFIPFTFVGAQNNGAAIGKAPLDQIASVNIAHYRNSADYEDSAYYCGQPQVWMAGLDEAWRDHLEKSGIYFGSRTPFLLPVNGSAGILQAQPNTLAKEAMDSKEKQLASLGARLIMADKSVKTATQQTSEDVAAHSVLSLACDNVSAAYTVAVGWLAMFANVAGEVEISIPTEFTKFTIDAGELTALMDGVMRGLIPRADLWSRLRQAGVIDSEKTDEAIQEEIDATTPQPALTDDDPDETVPPGGPPA